MITVVIKTLSNVEWTRSFRWVDRAGTPLDLSGMPMRMQVRAYSTRTGERVLSRAVAADLSTENGSIVIDPAEVGRFTLNLPKLRPGVYAFDLVREEAGSDRLLMMGEIHCEEGVTA